jgi:thiol-disulfide isomerase/thioredoxin
MNQRETTYAKWLAIAGGILLVAAAVSDYWPSNTSLPWLSFDEAKVVAASEKKPVLVDVYADWCGPCKNMEKNVFPNDSVQLVLKSRYVLAKINGDEPVVGDTLRNQLHIKAYPTYIVLTPAGQERKRHVGFFPVSNFLRWLDDSSDVPILQWPDLDKALAEGASRKRRVMVLVLGSIEHLESANGLFGEANVAGIVAKNFVPTLLVADNSANRAAIERLGFRPAAGAMGEVVILESDRREAGRFRVDAQMEFSTTTLANKLTEFTLK